MENIYILRRDIRGSEVVRLNRHRGGRPREGLNPNEPGIKTIIYIGASLRERVLRAGLTKRKNVEAVFIRELRDPKYAPSMRAEAGELEATATRLRAEADELDRAEQREAGRIVRAAEKLMARILLDDLLQREIEEGAQRTPNRVVPAFHDQFVEWSYKIVWAQVQDRLRQGVA